MSWSLYAIPNFAAFRKGTLELMNFERIWLSAIISHHEYIYANLPRTAAIDKVSNLNFIIFARDYVLWKVGTMWFVNKRDLCSATVAWQHACSVAVFLSSDIKVTERMKVKCHPKTWAEKKNSVKNLVKNILFFSRPFIYVWARICIFAHTFLLTLRWSWATFEFGIQKETDYVTIFGEASGKE